MLNLTTSPDHVVRAFDECAGELANALRLSRVLRPFFGGSSGDVVMPAAYCAYLKVTEAYVRWTVPMLRASARALASGDDEDRRWSRVLGGDALEETDPADGSGHDRWAADDMRTVGAPEALVAAPMPRALVGRYRQFMVDHADHHPYGALGAKGVLEHLAVGVADEFARGLLASGMPGIENGVRFISSHGVLDIDHVRTGDELIRSMQDDRKLAQILEGAIVTREAYHSFVVSMEDLYDLWSQRWS